MSLLLTVGSLTLLLLSFMFIVSIYKNNNRVITVNTNEMFSPISATSRRLFQQDVTVTLAMFDSAVGLLYLLCFYNSCELLGGSFKSFTKSVKTVQITVTL